MQEIKIKNKMSKQWQGTQDNSNVLYAIETARTFGNTNAVDQNWRWLAMDLGSLYETSPEIAAATYCFIRGWVAGATRVLNKALSSFLGESEKPSFLGGPE